MYDTTKKERIVSKAIALLIDKPKGLRYSELKSQLNKEFFDISNSTINGYIVNLEYASKGEVYKADRGLFKHKNFSEVNNDEQISPAANNNFSTRTLKEEEFYQPFADWLVNDLEECTRAIPLGGSVFKDKWGTPDVIGVRETRRSAIIKLPPEIVATEIKIDTNALITAFGQACSYKLFSHKSYIVAPKQASERDITRMDSLCRIFGIGLILFNSNDEKEPAFEIRVRAIKHEPDMFYVEKYMRDIEDDLFPRQS